MRRIEVVGEGVHKLSDGCHLVVAHDVFGKEEMQKRVIPMFESIKHVRAPGVFGHDEPRLSKTYHPDGRPYRFGGHVHGADEVPEDMQTVLETIRARVCERVPDARILSKMGHATALRYGPETPRGGSIGRHADDEDPSWGLVTIFSVGQARDLMVGPKGAPVRWRIPMMSNSIVAMVGVDFQKRYTHGVNKLGVRKAVGVRHSINARYGPAA